MNWSVVKTDRAWGDAIDEVALPDRETDVEL